MKIEKLKKVLRYCTSEICFHFNSKFYKHRSGVSMGSPLALVLSGIFLQFIEKNRIFPRVQEFGIEKYYRYVDDIFVLDKDDRQTESLVMEFNLLHQNLKFTCEMEGNNSMNFLDVSVIGSGERFSTLVFRKSMHPFNIMR